MKRIFPLILFVTISILGNAQSWQDTVVLIEKIFDRYKPANPGCQLTISRNGQIIYSHAWGMADMEHNIPLTTESVIEAGSVSKQFTAAAILLLEQQGKLSLNDDVRKYVPEIPDYGTPVTLRHMMQHTSGLKDWGSIAAVAGWPRSTKTYNNDDALYIISKQRTLNNKPGDEYIYSNSNYNLFAIITERVSGMSLAEFTRIHIFEPAGMKHTEWRNDFKKIVPNRAIAYEKKNDNYFTDMPNEYVYGNGGLLTTTEDLIAWNNYYLNNKLGNPSLLSRQLSTTALNNGIMNPYGAGLRIDSVRGWKSISHNGATASYRASLQHYPDLALSIAWLSNSSAFDGSIDATNRVRDLFVKDKSVLQSRDTSTAIIIPIEKLKEYVGWYRDTRNETGVKLFVKDGKLNNSRGGNLIPLKENIFSLGRNRVEVIQVKKEKQLHLISPFETIVFYTVDSAIVGEQAMKEYTGEYYSEEAESKLTISFKDGKLIAHRDPKTDYPLTPTYKDGFDIPAGSVYFERDKKKRIAALKIYVGRARNIVFTKKSSR